MQRTEFGKNLRKTRKSKGLTQKILAEKVGLTDAYICRLEINNRYPKIETLLKLAAVLEISLDELMFGEKHAHKS